jgi:hypothetical protein
MTKREALCRYYELAQTIQFFGMVFFEAKDAMGNDVLMSVAEDGLHLFKRSNMVRSDLAWLVPAHRVPETDLSFFSL